MAALFVVNLDPFHKPVSVPHSALDELDLEAQAILHPFFRSGLVWGSNRVLSLQSVWTHSTMC